MQFQSYRPLPPLADFVDRLWLSQGAAPPHQMERLLPDCTVELVINLHQDLIHLYDRDDHHRCNTAPGCVLSGPRTRYFVIDTQDQTATMGVHFRPGGAFPFFRVPATNWLTSPLPSMHFGVRQHLRFASACSRLRRRKQVPRPGGCLLEQLAKPLERHPAVSFGIRQLRGTRAPRLRKWWIRRDTVNADSSRYSGNRLGSPQGLGRVSRFQRVIQIAHGADEIDWADVAIDCGYYDQAHFIHDFESFAGITPATYLLQRTQHLNHVPLAE